MSSGIGEASAGKGEVGVRGRGLARALPWFQWGARFTMSSGEATMEHEVQRRQGRVSAGMSLGGGRGSGGGVSLRV